MNISIVKLHPDERGTGFCIDLTGFCYHFQSIETIMQIHPQSIRIIHPKNTYLAGNFFTSIRGCGGSGWTYLIGAHDNRLCPRSVYFYLPWYPGKRIPASAPGFPGFPGQRPGFLGFTGQVPGMKKAIKTIVFS